MRRTCRAKGRSALTIDRYKIFQFFKYSVYLLLMLNVYLFFSEEWAAASHRFAGGMRAGDIIEGFAASIDTAAWVVLLLMFELQTAVLADDRISKRLTVTLHALRALCYIVIVYAFFGYLTKLLFLFGAAPLPAIADLCSLAGGQWAYAIDFDEYATITAANCAEFSTADTFYRLTGMNALVDPAGLSAIVRLAWVDVINSAVWLLVVLLLEIDVRLQEKDRLTGLALRLSTLGKYVLYSIIFVAAVYWGVAGDFVDFWDAFLWLVAFVFIEMNVFEWRMESLEQDRAKPAAAGLQP